MCEVLINCEGVPFGDVNGFVIRDLWVAVAEKIVLS